MVVSEEVIEFVASNRSIAVSIDSLEKSERSEISNVAQSLARALENSFSVSDSNEQVLKSVF